MMHTTNIYTVANLDEINLQLYFGSKVLKLLLKIYHRKKQILCHETSEVLSKNLIWVCNLVLKGKDTDITNWDDHFQSTYAPRRAKWHTVAYLWRTSCFENICCQIYLLQPAFPISVLQF